MTEQDKMRYFVIGVSIVMLVFAGLIYVSVYEMLQVCGFYNG